MRFSKTVWSCCNLILVRHITCTLYIYNTKLTRWFSIFMVTTYLKDKTTVTKRTLGKRAEAWGQLRYKEHTAGRNPRTAVGEHLNNTGHKCSLKEAKILDNEDQVSRRRIKKAIRIHQGRPGLNRDTGLDIPAVILQLVSHDPEGSCDTNGHLSYHPLTKAERFCRKFGNFFHHNFDSVYRMSHLKELVKTPA